MPFNFPAQYEPFERLRIGSNSLENVKALVSFGDTAPLLIGNGPTPRVWLWIPADRTGSRWHPLIRDNFSTHPDVKVDVLPKLLTVKTPQGTVLSAIKSGENFLSVQRLDLRQFGLNIYADEQSLHIMGSVLSKNEFRNINVIVGIGT